MAPNLAISQRRMIHDMILSNGLTAAQMADAAGCSVRAVKYIRSNLRAFGSVEAPWNGGGRPRSVTPIVLEALREYLLEKPDQYLDEISVFLWDEFGTIIPTSTISRTLKSAGWSKKGVHQAQLEHVRRGHSVRVRRVPRVVCRSGRQQETKRKRSL